MRHKMLKKFIKLACSWILIFTMCFLSLDSVRASEEETPVMEIESEVLEAEEEVEESIEKEEAEEPSEESIEKDEVMEAPEVIEVCNLSEELMTSAAVGIETSTDKVEYVDNSGNPITGAPVTIEFGNINEHTEITIPGKHYEFKSAKVNGKDCVYIGVYKESVYYSTDGIIAIKLEDGQKLILTYLEYYNITVNEVIPESGVGGTITTKDGPIDLTQEIRVNDGEDWTFTVTPGAGNKKRNKIVSVISQNSAVITRDTGDEYGATYTVQVKKDDVITITYNSEGIYRVTINTKGNDGIEYIHVEHSTGSGKYILDESGNLTYTFTEANIGADKTIYLPEFHTKRGYRLIHMTLNGHALVSENGQNEVPTNTGSGNIITAPAGKMSVTTRMTEEYNLNTGKEKNCSYEYKINVKAQSGEWQDLKFDLVPYPIEQQVLTVRLMTDGCRSGNGLDVVTWNQDTKMLEPVKDNDTFNMDSVGTGVLSLQKRQVRIFFAKAKNGYSEPIGSYGQISGYAYTEGGKARAEKGNVSELSATTMGGVGEFAIYDNMWEEAKIAAQNNGYTKFVVLGGEKTINTDWELFAVSFQTACESLYVHYNAGVGEDVLPEDAVVSNIPENTDLLDGKPMCSYGENPATSVGKRTIGKTFIVGEGLKKPKCDGYKFIGWKLKNKNGELSREIYQNSQIFQISEENYQYADNIDLPLGSFNNKKGYQFIAQWEKSGVTVKVNHYLKVPDGTVILKKTTIGTITFATDGETVIAIGKSEPDGTFPGYSFDESDSRNMLEKSIANDVSVETIDLNLYYKPTILIVKKEVTGYIFEADRQFSFEIQAKSLSGTEDIATISDGNIFIRKGSNLTEKLIFTANKGKFTLGNGEFVEISGLPEGWLYTIVEEDLAGKYKTKYKLNDGAEEIGNVVKFTLKLTTNEQVEFTNVSLIAPPVTGRRDNSTRILLLLTVVCVSIGSMGFIKTIKQKTKS